MNILHIKNERGEWVSIPAIQGPPGKDGNVSFADLTDEQRESLKGDTGAQGPKGDAYTITTADYDAIAEVVYGKMTNASVVKY